MTMWHGGAPGRKVGDGLLPPSETKFWPTNAHLTGKPKKGKVRSYKSTKVYATTDREFAEVWAIMYTQDTARPGDGLVYEVELDSPAIDPDFATAGVCFEAPRGKIVGAGAPVTSSEERLAAVLEKYRSEGASANAARAERTRRRSQRTNQKTARRQNRSKK